MGVTVCLRLAKTTAVEDSEKGEGIEEQEQDDRGEYHQSHRGYEARSGRLYA